jgi:type I restriction enzyme, S subunit
MSWPLKELGEFAVLRGGSVNPANSPTEEFDLYSIPAFDVGKPEIARGSEIGSSKKVVQPNDVLISRIVPHIRRSWVVGPENGRRLIASGEWIVFRSAELLPNYLRHYLLSDPFHVQFMQTVSGVGGSLLRARPAEVYKIKVPLPPIAEQKRIAVILDAADDLRTKRRESLAQLEFLLQSTFLDLFGDPVTNPKGWEKQALGEWLDSIDSGWSPRCLDRPADLNEWGVLKLGAVTWCSFNEKEQKALPDTEKPRPQIEVHEGDLLFARKNTYDLVAAVAYVEQVRPRLMLPDLIFRLRLNPSAQILPKFLWQLMIEPRQRREIQSLAGGAAGSMPNISKAKLNTVSLIKPPIDLQLKFSRIVDSIADQRRAMEHQLTELETLFASLQSRAFRGEL